MELRHHHHRQQRPEKVPRMNTPRLVEIRPVQIRPESIDLEGTITIYLAVPR